MTTIPKMSADEALHRLLEGNRRFAANQAIGPNRSENRRREIVNGQNPFAIVLGCVDSRVPPELIFDQGLGDLFVIRSAGQVIDDAVLGSIEFGVEELDIPLILVLGHTRCGAVTATFEILENNLQVEGSIGSLIQAIRPSIHQAHGDGVEIIDLAAKINVGMEIQRLSRSTILSREMNSGNLKIAGGFYHLDTGIVEILEIR